MTLSDLLFYISCILLALMAVIGLGLLVITLLFYTVVQSSYKILVDLIKK